MIRASAGSGKTWQLANRYLALVVLGVRPEKIVALTFTRKAAGEFADRILTELAAGAGSKEGAAKLASQIEATVRGCGDMLPLVSGEVALPEMNQGYFQHKLKEMVSALDKLTLSTLDSFFVKIVRYFTFELGLAGFELIQGSTLEREKLSVLTEMFSSKGVMAKSYQSFLDAFKLATMGNEEAKLSETLQDFVKEYHQRWLKSPSVEKWGNPAMLWGSSTPWLLCEDKKQKAERAAELLSNTGLHKSLVKTLVVAAEWIAEHEKGAPLEGMPAGVSRMLESIDEIRSGLWTITYSKKEYTLQGEVLQLLDEVVSDFVRGEIELRLERTRGVFEVIDTYERLYQSRVRGQGKLGFSDIGLLLSGHDSTGLWDEVARELVDFRFDGRYDHWMLDEFQDTSRIQWAVIQNLIDEIMYSQEGDRSLFVVGDTKQGIYGWRGGDSELFDELSQRYGESLRQSPMDQSWRSTPEVLDLLNTVCDPGGAAMQELFQHESVQKWRYDVHTSARGGKGHAWVCEVEESDELSGTELQHAWIGEILKKVNPVGRNLSCAVIVRRNSEAVEIGHYLREHHPDIPVAMDSEVTVTEDNPVSYAIGDAFRYLAHPGDTLALNHLKMCPLSAVLGFDLSSEQSVWHQWSRKLAGSDVAAILREWIQGLGEIVDLSSYSLGRLNELERAAAQFVQSGGGLEDWLSELEKWQQKEVTREGVVQIMTVHKSKGLGFDVVILPGFDSTPFDSVAKLNLLEKKAGQGAVHHHLLFPPKVVASADRELRGEMEQWQADQSYEAFCVLYVALSRAKSGIYCLLPEQKKSAKPSRRNTDWIRLAAGDEELRAERLGDLQGRVLYESGGWEWLDSKIVETNQPQNPDHVRLPVVESSKKDSVLASDHSHLQVTQRLMDRKGAQIGNDVHAMFESIEWHDGGSIKLTGDKTAAGLVKDCLEVDSIAEIFTRKSGVTVYREVPVEAVIDGEWLSGVIDRLHVLLDSASNPVAAEIIDFKTDATNHIEELAERHSKQLSLYQKAVARIYGISPENVSRIILSTHHKSVLKID